MLISKEAKIAWNSKIKNSYVEKGYTFTFMRDPLWVKVEDLKDGSAAIVEVECDYCHKRYGTVWNRRVKYVTNGTIKNDVCGDCAYLKARDTSLMRYGVTNPTLLDQLTVS